MNRRKFLSSAGLILGAPAIVRAESLMKIWVPPEPVWIGVDWSFRPVSADMEAISINVHGDVAIWKDGKHTVVSSLHSLANRPRIVLGG